ncbi:DEAD/DEAH box helicase [Iamia sp.]|uniref:DEAD/DEAH box helicase n=1 Tax=Iamia sp. TaxID=2722710 RepID=UPI002CDEB369|nr:DEAD/DEAH box helicase [Iamia sp.]HXH59422.1 DEAD/DEAH box helicase [Iamia sp.]
MSPTFAALGVPAPITRVLTDRGITEPFPIQTATLQNALAGRDVCGRAPTGSGKTIAFGIPLAARITNASPKRPKGLVLVPTRELAAQVRDELDLLLHPMGRTVHAFYGGVGFGPQLAALRKGVDVVVACPGRLADLVHRGDVRLDRVNFVVVDEADRMADMGFLPEVRRLLDQVMPDRQTLLFSATLDGDVDTLIRNYQKDPARHGVDADEDAPVNQHVLWQAERDTRVAITADIVSAHWPAIVFSRTKHGADRLSRQLSKLGVAAEAIHGNRSQGQRERALRNFTTGRVQALIATDVAARGIHVDGVRCVVHFDAPPDPKDFVHRSGRTGRAGAEGLVVTLAPRSEGAAVAKMMRKAGVEARLASADVGSLGAGSDRPAPAPVAAAPSEGGRRSGERSRGERTRDDRGATRTHRSGGGPSGRGRDGSGSSDSRPSRKGDGPRRQPRRTDATGKGGHLNHDGERRSRPDGVSAPSGSKPGGSRRSQGSGGGRGRGPGAGRGAGHPRGRR